MGTIKAALRALWQAKTSRGGAFFHVASLFIVTVGLVTAELRMQIFDVEGYAFRLAWIVGATGWALRMLYLADREPEGSRQMQLARRGGVIMTTSDQYRELADYQMQLARRGGVIMLASSLTVIIAGLMAAGVFLASV